MSSPFAPGCGGVMTARASAQRLLRLLAVLLLTALGAMRADAASREARAPALSQRARRRSPLSSADPQRAALDDFEEAARLAPRRKDVWLALGKACLESGR